MTGIKPADLLNQPTIEEILPDFLDFIKGHLVVAHNAPFDISFLYQAIIDCAITDVEAFVFMILWQKVKTSDHVLLCFGKFQRFTGNE